ncbi:hypothetical protein evm_012978 [Chilo suppressalis]|nr:hypothetical protein evm_012978 [Chilo suppressalis]
MSAFKVTLICLQALLIQHAYCQLVSYGSNTDLNVDATNSVSASLNGYNVGLPNTGYGISNIALTGLENAGYAVTGLSNAGVALSGVGYGAGVPNVAATSGVPVTGPFTATGNAEMAVSGDFEVTGQTVVGGQIPVIGSVTFSGQIPARGVVSAAGNCGCSNVPL